MNYKEQQFVALKERNLFWEQDPKHRLVEKCRVPFTSSQLLSIVNTVHERLNVGRSGEGRMNDK
jgi:hypothetical protein